MFSWEWFGAEPDILVIGKGLGGALMPIAAVIARSELDIVEEYSIGHYTHEKNPVSCAAALATLEVIDEEGLVERSRSLGLQMLESLQTKLAGCEHVVEVRGLGLLIGVELRDPILAERVLYECLSKGLSFKISAGTVLTLAPPLNIAEADLERAISIVVESIKSR